ncbi:MAG TPA: hypothetical protein PKM73_04645 [Verrucomicrobiota bacterium]|nr:hypothetical protein [Verrucomicrobiota bacterium]HNU50626.1 hypothetical protein [Verrucomicrobiota bacterium]
MKTHRAHDSSRSIGWFQFVLALLIASTVPCLAATLSVGTHSARPGTSLVRIPIQVLGGEWVSEMSAVVLVNGGGLLLGGLPGPGIAGVDFTGSIWGGSDADRVVFGDQPGGAQFAEPSVALRAPGQRTAANGIAFTLLLNIAGFPPGRYPIALGSTNPAIGSSRFFLAGAAVPVATEPGVLEISDDQPLTFRVDIVRQTGDGLALRFPTVARRTYRVEASDAIQPPQWATVSDPLSGTGGTVEWPVPQSLLTGHPRRFFRIESRPQ